MREQNDMENVCLNAFIKYGLYNTSVRVACNEMGMSSGNFQTYFKSKDDMVLKCATLAAKNVANKAILHCIKEVFGDEPNIGLIVKKLKAMMPSMAFLMQAYNEVSYKKDLIDIFETEGRAYHEYAVKLATEKGCDVKRIEGYISIFVTACTNFMIFADDVYFLPQMDIVLGKINGE